MNVTFRQLRLLLALADTGSVTAAARRMHITQPTASMQLKELASTVGLPLFEVIAKKIHMTEVGLELANSARIMAAEWETFEQKVMALKGVTRGRLKIAVVSTAKYFVPRVLGSFCQRYPEIDIALEVLNREGVIERLEKNMDDMYIMSRPPLHIEIEDEVFMPNPLVIIANKAHPLAHQPHITLDQLSQDRFILREMGSGTRMACDMHFKDMKFTPNIRLELGSNEAIKEAVASDLGIGVISIHAIHDYPHQTDITVLDVTGFPIHANWHIVTSKGKKLSPIASIFHDELLLEGQRLSARHPTDDPVFAVAT
ncbi:LysR family transcriptional regulator [Methylovorus mays]|uniref:LysR family transcriptional regulator n=1 Tax=Methylovorus mays TaxID=184077 RepID=UPI001E5A95F3|nr:LysR family transcriptional regulator [Methylovorus mays]MCB5205805.1 LysR family transcriptional regulator [Methylovorus mays]